MYIDGTSNINISSSIFNFIVSNHSVRSVSLLTFPHPKPSLVESIVIPGEKHRNSTGLQSPSPALGRRVNVLRLEVPTAHMSVMADSKVLSPNINYPSPSDFGKVYLLLTYFFILKITDNYITNNYDNNITSN